MFWTRFAAAGIVAALAYLLVPVSAANAEDALESLGQSIFFDTTLSEPPGQSCAACHGAEVGWTGPNEELNRAGGVYEGAVHGRFGMRKPPSVAYAAFTPPLQMDHDEDYLIGGLFWDGRATGWALGTPAGDQVQGPFLSPLEQNNGMAQRVVGKICDGSYGVEFKAYFGTRVCADPVQGYNAVAQAVVAFERSKAVNPFSSKYDYYLRDPRRYPLSKEEARGLELFDGADKGNCAACHPSKPGADGQPPLFTDFSFDNVGIPPNPDNPWYRMGKEFNPDAAAWVDPGLGGFIGSVGRFAERAGRDRGKLRVPTLRNVDKRPRPDFVKAYTHNGVFKSLKTLVHFYNTRDVKPVCASPGKPDRHADCWPPPEIAENINREETGDRKLTEAEEDAIVAFLKTLSDGWTPP